MPSIELGPRRIEYSVIKGTGRRYTYFRFRQDLILEIVLPRGMRVDVTQAILERSDWLRREYDRLSRTRRVLTEEAVMYRGKDLKLIFSPEQGEKITPDEANGVAVVCTSDRRRLRELVRRWFLRESSAYAVRKVADLAPIVGARPSRVDVREIGKWGYCTREGRLSFSWQLIALPERLGEYVVMHELTHLLVFNHSVAFRRKLASFCPDYRTREKELDLVVPYNKLALG